MGMDAAHPQHGAGSSGCPTEMPVGSRRTIPEFCTRVTAASATESIKRQKKKGLKNV